MSRHDFQNKQNEIQTQSKTEENSELPELPNDHKDEIYDAVKTPTSGEIVSVDEWEKIKDLPVIEAIVSNTSSVNLRSSPEKKTDNVVSVLPEGTVVRLVEPAEDDAQWLHVTVVGSGGVDGYIMEKYLTPKEG